MVKRVSVTGVGVVEFPDGMSDDDISNVLTENFYQKPDTAADAGVIETAKQAGLGLRDKFGEGSGNTVGGLGKILQAPIETAKEMGLGLIAGISDKEDGRYAGRKAAAEEQSRIAQDARQQNINNGNAFSVAGKAMEDAGANTQQYWSNALKEDAPILARQEQNIQNANGFVDTMKAIGTNPLGALGTVAQSAPDMVIAARGAGMLGKAAMSRAVPAAEAAAAEARRAALLEAAASPKTAANASAIADQAAKEAYEATIRNAGETVAGRAAAVAESGQSAMSTRQGVEQQIMGMDPGKLYENNEYFRRLVDEEGKNPIEAKQILASQLGAEAALPAAAATYLGAKVTGGADALGKTVLGGPMSRRELASRIGKEGMEEAMQGPGEDYAQYHAAVQADPEQKYDFGGSLAQNLAAGIMMGGPAHGAGYVGQSKSGVTLAGMPIEKAPTWMLERALNVVDQDKAPVIQEELARRSSTSTAAAPATDTTSAAAPIDQNSLLQGAEQHGIEGQGDQQQAATGNQPGVSDGAGGVAAGDASAAGGPGQSGGVSAGASVAGNGQAGHDVGGSGEYYAGVAAQPESLARYRKMTDAELESFRSWHEDPQMNRHDVASFNLVASERGLQPVQNKGMERSYSGQDMHMQRDMFARDYANQQGLSGMPKTDPAVVAAREQGRLIFDNHVAHTGQSLTIDQFNHQQGAGNEATGHRAEGVAGAQAASNNLGGTSQGTQQAAYEGAMAANATVPAVSAGDAVARLQRAYPAARVIQAHQVAGSPARKNEAKLIQKLFAKIGVQAHFVNVPPNSFGGVHYRTMPGHIFINQRELSGSIRSIAGHEFLHNIRTQAPELYEKLVDALQNNGAANLTKSQFQPLYDNRTKDRTELQSEDHATEEQVANLMGNLFQDPKRFQEILDHVFGDDVKGAAKMVAKLKAAIKSVIDEIKSLGKGYDSKTYEGDLKKTQAELMAAFKAYAAGHNVNAMAAEAAVAQAEGQDAVQSPEETVAKENREGVIIGARPGEFDWSVATGGIPAPIQHPVQLAPRVDRLGPAVGKILNSKAVKQLAEDLFGITGLKVYPTLGQYKGKPEPSFAIHGDGMTFEAADGLSRLLGFAFAQESAIVTQATHAGDADSDPAFYVGNGKKLTAKEVDAVRQEAQNQGLDYSTSIDGKYVKFFFPGGDISAYYEKVEKVAAAGGLKNIDRVQTRSKFNEAKDYLGSEAEGAGRQAWVQEGGTGSSSLFGRTIDHLVVPYAKAVGAEGYRFAPDLFADRFGLSPQQREYLRAALRPKSGKALSTAGIVAGREKIEATKSDTRSKNPKSNNTDVMWALQNRAAAVGQIEPGDYSDEAKKAISEALADEVVEHISRPGGKSAIGWYDAALKKAKQIYDQVFPELKSNKDREMLFDALLGIASQGNDVHSNSVYAGRMYYLITRKGMTISQAVETLYGTFGGETRAIENNFLKFEELIDRNGYDKMRKLFNKKMTVGEWNALLRRDQSLFYGGEALEVEGAARQRVNGWMVFGPKIGSFINNLHGDYSTLTADLWFSRTWNRVLGFSFLHTPLKEADKYQSFKEALIAEHTKTTEPRSIGKDGKAKAWEHGEDINFTDDQLDKLMADPDAMLALANELYDYYKNGFTFSHDKKDKQNGFSTKSDLRRAAKNWIEHREDSVAAPRNDNERAFQQETVEAAQRIIKRKTGDTISIADIQAALWYHEKELFAHFGATDKKKKPADYADAALGFMEKYNDGDLFYVEKPSPRYIVGEKGTYLDDALQSPDTGAGTDGDAQQGRGAASELPPQFGQGRQGAVKVRGVHYSKATRQELIGALYGTGMKGEERERLSDPKNADIRSRVYFYVDEGHGVTPESDVGPNAHDVDLANVYDVKADPLGYRRLSAGDASAMERLIKKGGFDGYYAPGLFGNQGVAVMVGDHNIPVRQLGTGYRGGEAVASKQEAPADRAGDVVRNDRRLPMGRMTGAEWKAILKDAGLPLEDSKGYYKDQVARALDDAGDAMQSPSQSQFDGSNQETRFSRQRIYETLDASQKSIYDDGVKKLSDAMIRHNVNAHDVFGFLDNGRKRAALERITDGIDKRLLETGLSKKRDESGNAQYYDVVAGYQQDARTVVAKHQDEERKKFDIRYSPESLDDLATDQQYAVRKAIDRAIAMEQGRDVPAIKRESALLTLRGLRAKLEAGKIGEQDFIAKVNDLQYRLESKRAAKAYEPVKGRERGADYIRERLLQAKRRGEISAEAVDLAEWFIKQNPDLVEELGISIKTPGEGEQGSRGRYMPVTKVMRLFKDKVGDETVVHEILHHLERMMPVEMQDAIRREYNRRVSATMSQAQKDGNKAVQEYLGHVLDYSISGNKKSVKKATDLIQQNKVPASLYSLLNASEFWAVNGASILAKRAAAGGVWGKVKQWLGEAVQRIAGAVGLRSDAPIIKAMNDLIKNGDGQLINKDMIGLASEFMDSGDAMQSPGAQLPEETRTQKAQRVVQDQFNRFNVIQDWLKENGLQLSEQANVYLAEERYHGRAASRIEDFREKTVNPLIEETQRAGFTMAQVAEYLHAQHAEERNKQIAKINPKMPDGGSGMKTADARAILANAPAGLDAIANKWQAITHSTRSMLLKSGIISQEMNDAWEAAYDHYVPLKGGDEVVQGGTGKGLSVNGKQKGAMGHGERDEMVIENILRDHERAILLTEKNLVGMHLLQFLLEAQNSDIGTVSKPQKRAVLKNGAVSYDVQYHGSTVQSFQNLQDARNFIALQGKQAGTYSIVKTQGNPMVTYTAAPQLQPNEVQVYVQGQAIRIQLNDELLARAYTRMGTEQLGTVLKVARDFNNYLSKAYTGYNPEFFARNIVRDFSTGMINITGERGVAFSAKVVANYPKAFARLFKYARTGQASADIQAYRANGGSTGAAYLTDLERVGRDVVQAYQDAAGFMETARTAGKMAAARVLFDNVVAKLAHWIEVFNQAGENAMRLAAYNTATQEGLTTAQAASLAKNCTVNFNRKGELGSQMSALWLFANPSIQGTAALIKALKSSEHKWQARALTGGMMALAFTLSMMRGDDDGDDLQQSDYDKNVVIKVGNISYKIPVPYGYGYFYALGNLAADVARGKVDAAKASLRAASAFAENFSPFGNPWAGEKADAKNLVQMVPITPVKMALQIAENQSSFGSKIVPDYGDTDFRPDSQKMNRTTKGSSYAKITEALNAATGGSKVHPGWVDVSPETLKFLTQSIVGGTGKFIDDSAHLVWNLAKEGVTPDLHEVPVIRAFMAEERIGVTRARFYDAVAQAKQAQDELNRAKKLHDKDLIASTFKEDGWLIALAHQADAQKKLVTAKRNQEDKIMADDTKTIAEKRAAVKELENIESVIYRRFMQQFNAAEAAAKARKSGS